MKITGKTLQKWKKTAQDNNKTLKRSVGNNLTLESFPNGKQYWRWRYKFSGKPKTLSFGCLPEVTLHDANHLVVEARRKVKQNIDPSAERQDLRRSRILNAKNTFEAVAEEWHAQEKQRWEKRHAENIISRLRRDIFPLIGKIPVSEIEAKDVAAAIKGIIDRNETARRALQNCGQVCRYAVQTGRAKYDVTSALKGFVKGRITKHYGTISSNELPHLVKKIRGNDVQLFKQTRIALEMMLLTFVRTSELMNARWSEFDFQAKTWIIPAERMKMKREHLVPLSRQVLSMLEELQQISGKREHIFPSIPRPFKPMSNATLLRALEKLGYRHTMTGHGFRALAMTTMLEKLNIPFEFIDKQLAHRTKGAVRQAYDRALYIDQRTKMMQTWADYIDRIADGQDGKVYQIKERLTEMVQA